MEVGVDIVSIERVRRALEDGGDRFITQVFTSLEREAASASADPVTYLATAFAAKEAVFKTMDIDWDTGVQLNEVEVHNAPNGRPYVKLIFPSVPLGDASQETRAASTWCTRSMT